MIPRDVVETVALVALFIISGGLCVLAGYALGMTRGEHDGARRERVLSRAWSRIECEPPAVSPGPEPVTVSSPDVTVVSNSGGATAVSGAAVAVVDARGRR